MSSRLPCAVTPACSVFGIEVLLNSGHYTSNIRSCITPISLSVITRAMRFLENTELLKIEDILPFFPDFVVIDDFKEEICTALEGYSAHIDALKADMDEATKNAEAIKQDIAALQKRFITVDASEKCSSCALALMTRQFYVFPCHHTFHADCLIGLVRTRGCSCAERTAN